MRNVKTRECFKYWDKICSLTSYGFLHSPDNQRILKTPDIGNWIDKHEAQTIVDEAQDEINELQAQLATVTKDAEQGRVSGMTAIADLQQRLTAAEQRNSELEKNAARYIWLRDKSESVHQFYLSTPIWFTGVKFNPENVDRTIDAALKPTESGASDPDYIGLKVCVSCSGNFGEFKTCSNSLLSKAYFVKCASCGASTSAYDKAESAVKEWNSRSKTESGASE